jgi:hypothetical protein
MRQREKRKEHREERKRAKQEKLIALEEKKLSRREWLMAQPEVREYIHYGYSNNYGYLKRKKKNPIPADNFKKYNTKDNPKIDILKPKI